MKEETSVDAIVRRTLSSGPEHVLALHVPETERGASISVRKAFEAFGLRIHEMNAAYDHGRLSMGLRHHDAADVVVPDVFAHQGLGVVYVTGWGSDPRSADHLLRAVYPHVVRRPNLRLVAMNNASPVPHMFVQAAPTAHPEAEEFARHLGDLLRIDRDLVDLHVLSRDGR